MLNMKSDRRQFMTLKAESKNITILYIKRDFKELQKNTHGNKILINY